MTPSEFADIVILGAGYGGLHVAQRLGHLIADARWPDGSPWSILIIDRRPDHQLTTELPRIIDGQIADQAVRIPLDRLLDEGRVRMLRADVQAIRPETAFVPGAVETSAGRVEYRYLVIALGSVSNDFNIPGVHAHMRQFLSSEDARGLRIAVSRAIGEAARIELERPDADPAELARRMRVVVGGAGATGVEVAGELAEFMDGQWRAAWRVAGEPQTYPLPRPQIVLVSATPTVLPGWSPQTIQAVSDSLRELGVTLRLSAPITRAEPGRVQIGGGEWIAAETLLWAGGVRAPELLKQSGLPTGAGGRVIVDRFQRVPEQPGVFVVGDCALLIDPKSGRPAGPTADIALRSGETAALALAAIVGGRSPARALRPLARNAVSVGRARGAASLLGLRLKGRSARTIKRLIEWEYRQSITQLQGNSVATLA